MQSHSQGLLSFGDFSCPFQYDRSPGKKVEVSGQSASTAKEHCYMKYLL